MRPPSPAPTIAEKESSRLRLQRLCRHFDRLGWRGVNLLDQRLDRGAGHRPHVEIGGARLGEKIRILHRGVEGRAQRRELLRRHSGRRRERPRDALPRHDQLERRALRRVGGQIHDQRHAQQIGIVVLVQRDLQRDVDLVASQHRLVAAQQTRPRPAAAAVDFVALHRQRDLGAAGIAGDDADRHLEHVAQDGGEYIALGAAARGTDDARLGLHVLQGRDAGRGHESADADLLPHAAEPAQFCGVKLGAVAVAEQRLGDDAWRERTHRGAVFRRRCRDN